VSINRRPLVAAIALVLVLGLFSVACGSPPKVTLGYVTWSVEGGDDTYVPAAYVLPVPGTVFEFSNAAYGSDLRMTGYTLKITPPSGGAAEVVFSQFVYGWNAKQTDPAVVTYQAAVNGKKAVVQYADFLPAKDPADKSLSGMVAFGMSFTGDNAEPLMYIDLPTTGSTKKEQTYAVEGSRSLPQKLTLTSMGDKVVYSFEFSKYAFSENAQNSNMRPNLNGFTVTYTKSGMK